MATPGAGFWVPGRAVAAGPGGHPGGSFWLTIQNEPAGARCGPGCGQRRAGQLRV